MSNRTPSIPFWKSMLSITKLMKNPIPLINNQMELIEGDSYWAHLGLSIRTLMTQDVEIVQHVLQKNHKNYFKSKIQTELLAKYIGKGLLTSNGDYWLKQRRLIQPGFHKRHLESFMQIMNSEIANFVDDWETQYQDKPTIIDVNQAMSALTIRVVSRALFSSDILSEEITFIASSVDALQDAVVKDIRQPFFGWLRNINGEEKRNSKIAHQLYDLIKAKIDNRQSKNIAHGDLLDMLLNVRYESGEGMTNQQLIDEILILYAAGYETTANALSWTFYLLAKHPVHKTALLSELESIELSQTIQLDELRAFTFTKMVISESMRLYPPAWIVDRQAIGDDEIKGIKIKKGDILNMYLYGIHHDERHWQSAGSFKPERFDKDAIKNHTPFSYVPFGSGPRMCIGNQFANMEMMLSLYHILRSYDLELVDDKAVAMKPLVTLKPIKGIKMKLTKR